jgi:hypothetical protein
MDLFNSDRLAEMALRLLGYALSHEYSAIHWAGTVLVVTVEALLDPGVEKAIREWAATLSDTDRALIEQILTSNHEASEELKRKHDQWN